MKNIVVVKRGSITLTDKNIRIIELLAEGDTNGQIARKLKLSEQTIKNQIACMCRKVEAANRTALVVATIRAGLIKV